MGNYPVALPKISAEQRRRSIAILHEIQTYMYTTVFDITFNPGTWQFEFSNHWCRNVVCLLFFNICIQVDQEWNTSLKSSKDRKWNHFYPLPKPLHAFIRNSSTALRLMSGIFANRVSFADFRFSFCYFQKFLKTMDEEMPWLWYVKVLFGMLWTNWWCYFAIIRMK